VVRAKAFGLSICFLTGKVVVTRYFRCNLEIFRNATDLVKRNILVVLTGLQMMMNLIVIMKSR